ncbi:hypothetical protein Syn7502_00441 [Synechococcus sp. PCC 7502]|uniref:DUF502 domain-containing protein n=1 Tax=Synechococcus sp. PCC 7502 TaxID=1173263 RepID=UPI00029F83D2|nr:DUF502 domain-containing protein [Synechococcus sp. PCC 7502]AFY72601.1 hypothetical protein Syn7502_00441 [Synechococcus sp. PCC 7502]
MSPRKSNLKPDTPNRFLQALKNDLIAGLLVIIPLATTIWVTFSLTTYSIDLLTRIPKRLNPFVSLDPLLVNLINLAVGLAVPLLGIVLVGLMARNFVGQWLLRTGEAFVQSIPLAGDVYKTLKQLLGTLLTDTGNKFRRVVLVEYPRPGLWALGFVTGSLGGEIANAMPQNMISVFLPTTPNPTTGWYVIVPEVDVINLSMPVEDAFKIIVSGGIVTPEAKDYNLKTPLAPLAIPNTEYEDLSTH